MDNSDGKSDWHAFAEMIDIPIEVIMNIRYTQATIHIYDTYTIHAHTYTHTHTRTHTHTHTHTLRPLRSSSPFFVSNCVTAYMLREPISVSSEERTNIEKVKCSYY